MADDAQQKIDAYLNRMRSRLRGLTGRRRTKFLPSCAAISQRRPRRAEK